MTSRLAAAHVGWHGYLLLALLAPGSVRQDQNVDLALAEYASRRTAAPVSVDIADQALRRYPPGSSILRFGVEDSRRLLSTFVLEAASLSLAAGDSARAHDLVERACSRIRGQLPSSEFDRRWHHAAIAIISGFIRPTALDTHIAHARRQFPDDLRIRFSEAIAAEQRTFLIARGATTSSVDVGADNPGRTQADLRRAIQVSIAAYRRFEAIAAVSAEARLRLGHLHLRLGQFDRAIDWLDRVPLHTQDTVLQYLAHLFLGMAREAAGATSTARMDYERALSVLPAADTASLRLSSLLFREGNSVEATRLAETVFAAPPRRVDPWWTYYSGDLRLWSELIAQLRESLP